MMFSSPVVRFAHWLGIQTGFIFPFHASSTPELVESKNDRYVKVSEVPYSPRPKTASVFVFPFLTGCSGSSRFRAGPSSDSGAAGESAGTAGAGETSGQGGEGGIGGQSTAGSPSGSGGSRGGGGGIAGSGGIGGIAGVGGATGGSGSGVDDADGDGFVSDADCNDEDMNTFPLKNNQTMTIDRSVTICPGTYEAADILMENIDGIQVTGTDVRLNNSRIDLINVTNSTVEGFEVFGNIVLQDSDDNILQDLSLLNDCSYGIQLFASSGNSVRNISTVGPGAPMTIDSQDMFSSASNTIQDSDFFNSIGLACNGSRNSLVIYGINTTVENNVFDGISLALYSGGDNLVQGNDISSNLIGIDVDSDNNEIMENNIHDNQFGLQLSTESNGNIVTGNTISNYTQCILEDPTAGNTIDAGQCN